MIGARLYSGYRYFSDLHPKTESQYRHQQALAGVPIIGGWYGNYMRNASAFEVQKQNMARLGLNWADIKSPWSASFTSANPYGALASAPSIVSDNLDRLYDSTPEVSRDRSGRSSQKRGKYGGRYRRR